MLLAGSTVCELAAGTVPRSQLAASPNLPDVPGAAHVCVQTQSCATAAAADSSSTRTARCIAEEGDLKEEEEGIEEKTLLQASGGEKRRNKQ